MQRSKTLSREEIFENAVLRVLMWTWNLSKLISFDITIGRHRFRVSFRFRFHQILVEGSQNQTKKMEGGGVPKFIIETIFIRHDILGTEKNARIS